MIWLVLLAACAPKGVGTRPQPDHVTILHTNDMHAHFLPSVAEWRDGRPEIGGMERLDAEVRWLRAHRPRGSVLLLDGGDVLTGTPLSDLDVNGSKGGAMLDLMEAIGYDAWAVGNHEFDKGLDNLIAFAEDSDVPVLSANLRKADGSGPLLPNQAYSTVFERSGVKVGVIGVTTGSLQTLMRPADFPRIQLVSVEDAVRAEVEAIEDEADIVVVLSHIGIEDDFSLAQHVPGIDLIVGGHSHTPVTEAKKVGDTWIVQAGSYTRSLGVVDLVVTDDRIATLSYELRDLVPAPDLEASEPVREMVAAYRQQIEVHYGEVLAEAAAVLGRDYHHESALGRWITDALRVSTGADVALYNGGGLRADLGPGKVTRGALFDCFPFGNEVVTFEMSGGDLLALLLKNAFAEAEEKRGFLPVSGVRYSWRATRGAPEIVEATVGGEPLRVDATYVVATNSYIVEQWEKFLGVEPRGARPQGYTDFEAAERFAKERAVADPGDKRAVRLE
ncbi:MAG: bifunctional metallophosphatase/5'-nucleotidase [Myxococcota bacterium]